MSEPGAAGPGRAWADAGLAAALLAVDPPGLGGLVLRARHGPVRSAWLAQFARLMGDLPLRKLPPGADDQRLLGGLDLAATLAAGRPLASRGLLAEADGGAVLLPMAERAEPGTVARLAAALDTGEVLTERDGLSARAPARIAVVALDEGVDEEEAADPGLADRLAFRIDLSGVPRAMAESAGLGPADIAAARAALPAIALPDDAAPALAQTAAACGIVSLRAPILALRAARAALALFAGRLDPAAALEMAARLVIAPRALHPPAEPAPEEAEPPDTPPEPPEEGEGEPETPAEAQVLADRVLEAVAAALPPQLLADLARAAPARADAPLGRAGALRRAPDRGRPLGARPGRIDGRSRIDLVATLTAAAPWQPLRGGGPEGLAIRPEDIRIKRLKRHSQTASIFVVDASGSAAIARLAEAKGAVELLLAEAYVRRDQVALVAFRGQTAEVLLPPTAAPALAKRRLAALPGGGATPLAAGLEAGLDLARRLAAAGTQPQMLVLTDGRGNIARDGAQGRAQAAEDAEAVALACRRAGLQAMVIDTGARPRAEARALAASLGGRYLAMPRADAAAISAAAKAVG